MSVHKSDHTTSNTNTAIDELIAKYDDWHECDEYHIHDGTGEHEGHTPLPHNFDDDKLKTALTQLLLEARISEQEKHLDFHMSDKYSEEYRWGFQMAVEQFEAYRANRIAELEQQLKKKPAH